VEEEPTCKEKFKAFIEGPHFEYTIIFFIFVSSILLAIETPLDDPDSSKAKTLRVLDGVMTGIFLIEVCLKVYNYGLILNGPNSYLRSLSNILDFVIVVTSVINHSLILY